MEHPEIQWNIETKEWFCIRCFRTSDHMNREDAVLELSQFECIAANGSEPESFSVQSLPLTPLNLVSKLVSKRSSPYGKLQKSSGGVALEQSLYAFHFSLRELAIILCFDTPPVVTD